MVPGGFFWFSRFKVGFHDSRWVFMVIHGSRLFLWFMFPDQFFMVPGKFFMIPGGFL